MLEVFREAIVSQRKEKVFEKVVVEGRRKNRQSGRLQKHSSLCVLIPSCKSRNLAVEWCQITDLKGT